MIRVFLLSRKIKSETFLVNFFRMDSSMVIVLFIMVFLKLGFEGLTRMQICFAMARKIRCARSNAPLLGLFSEPGSNPFTGHSRILGLIFNISYFAVNCDLLLELYVVENNSQLIGSISFSSSSLSLVRFLSLKLDDRLSRRCVNLLLMGVIIRWGFWTSNLRASRIQFTWFRLLLHSSGGVQYSTYYLQLYRNIHSKSDTSYDLSSRHSISKKVSHILYFGFLSVRIELQQYGRYQGSVETLL